MPEPTIPTEPATLVSHLHGLEADGEAELLRHALVELLRGSPDQWMRKLCDAVAAQGPLSAWLRRLSAVIETWRSQCEAGAALGLAVAWQELTTFLVAEDERRVAERLTRLEPAATLGLVAPGLLHELNNRCAWFLADLQTATRTLTELAPEQTTPSAREEMAETVGQLASLADGALAMSKQILRVGGLAARETAAGPVDLREVIESAVRVITPLVKVKARLLADIESGLLLAGRRHQLDRAFATFLVAATQTRARYATLTVRGRRREGRAIVEILGDGTPGTPIPEALLIDPLGPPLGNDEIADALCLATAAQAVRGVGGSVERREEAGPGQPILVVELPLAGSSPPAARTNS